MEVEREDTWEHLEAQRKILAPVAQQAHSEAVHPTQQIFPSAFTAREDDREKSTLMHDTLQLAGQWISIPYLSLEVMAI